MSHKRPAWPGEQPRVLSPNGRGPHLEGRQEPQASSAFRTPTAPRGRESCCPWRPSWRLLAQLPQLRLSLSCNGEGNGNPLQCPCLENPRDGGAWWAAIYGVAQSRTRLKQLSMRRGRGKPRHLGWGEPGWRVWGMAHRERAGGGANLGVAWVGGVPNCALGVAVAAGNARFVCSWVPIDRHPVSEAEGCGP